MEKCRGRVNYKEMNMTERIQIAFCFDINMFGPACVSIGSLLDSKKADEHFDIHCIVDEKCIRQKEVLINIVNKRDADSSIIIYSAPDTFSSSYEVRGISTATYLRLTLHRVLPDIDKIIYSDVDVLFCDSIKGLWEINVDNYYFAGVKGTNNFRDKWAKYADFDYYEELDGLKGNYINAGILLMNLQRIREERMEDVWNLKAKRKYQYQDQDIINISCKNQILFMPLKYNVAAYLIPKWYQKYYTEGIFSKEEAMDAYKHPVILHYAGVKPWNDCNAFRADVWWEYVLSNEDIAAWNPELKKNYLASVIATVKHWFGK